MGAIENYAFSEMTSFKKNNIAIIGNMSTDFYENLVSNLSWNDTIYIFDTADNISKIEFLIRHTLNSNVKLITYKCYTKKFDSYAWNLCLLISDIKRLNLSLEIFTMVFYHGKHLFHSDIGLLQLCTKMINDNGLLVVYDCDWSIAKSPTMNPKVDSNIKNLYTVEQINTPQIQFLLDNILDNDFMEMFSISSSKTKLFVKSKYTLFNNS